MSVLAWIIVAAGAAGFYLLGDSTPPVDPAWELPAAETPADGALTVRYSGTATLLFSDGETDLMLDGWFTRPGPVRVLLGEIAPDEAAIDRGLALNEVDSLAAVIPVHSHYDHAMDAPLVAQRTGALLVGSEATANIGRGLGLAEERIRVVEHGDRLQFGQFGVTFLESRHFQFPDPDMVATLLTDSEIPQPLVPPADAFDYKLGKAWVLHIQHPLGDMVVVGSAGFVPGLLAEIDTDILFLGVGGLGSQSEEYRNDFWQYTAQAVNPERIVLIHWDSLTAPLEGPLVGEVRAISLFAAGGSETRAFLQARSAQLPAGTLQTLPRFSPVVLFEPQSPGR